MKFSFCPKLNLSRIFLGGIKPSREVRDLLKKKFKFQVFKFWRFCFKKLLYQVVLVSLVFSLLTPAFLYSAEMGGQKALLDAFVPPGAGAPVSDVALQGLAAHANAMLDFIEGKETLWKTLANAVYVASKEGLHYLLNTMAYDIASWLASGGEGQQPMFYTEGWGAYLKDVADSAAGTFVESLGEDWLGFNVCNPSSLPVKLSISLGIARTRRPQAPDCTVTEMVKNWDTFISDPNFLDKFVDIFNPDKNDIGIAFRMFDLYEEKKILAQEAATKDRESSEAKPVGDRIADRIFTPAFLVEEEAREMLKQGMVAEKEVDYGDIFMDAVSTFVNTLAGKLFQRIFKEGLAKLSGQSSQDSARDLGRGLASGLSNLADFFKGQDKDLYTGESGSQAFAGREAAQLRFLDFLPAGITKVQPYDVLSKLTTCSNPDKPGPDECVILADFRTAIDRKLTLREAISQGFIDGNKPFGFMDYDGGALRRGYPYRSAVILRTHRIVPVGWETAALAMNKYEPGKNYSLNDLIKEYNNPESLYYGLIDENWVLEVPEHFCRATGYGPKITSERVIPGTDANGDGDYTDTGDTSPTRNIMRQEYCADFQSCIKENDDGSCQYYGYCTEERRIWDLQGTGCPEYYNTCQTFQNSQSQLVSYLANSLDYNNCSIDNVGCQWYCQQYNSVSNVWTCVAEGERVLKPCLQPDGCSLVASCNLAPEETFCTDAVAGVNLKISEPCSSGLKWWNSATSQCRVSTSCLVPAGGVSCVTTGCETLTNLLPNPGFETATVTPSEVADKWQGNLSYFSRVSGSGEKIYSGKNSLRFYNAGTAITEVVTSDPITNLILTDQVGQPKKYTFSGFVYNNLNAGTIKIIVNDGNREISQKKDSWQSVSFDFTAAASVQVSIKITNNGGPVSGLAWFDNFKITESCITNPVTLTLVGTIDQNESKLHLDRQASECLAEADGCSQFIRLKENLGTNVIANGSFESWPLEENQRGWTATSANQQTDTAASGNASLMIENGGTLTQNLGAARAATSYYLSFWVKAEAATLVDGVKLSWQTPAGQTAESFKLNKNSTLNLTPDWQRLVLDAYTFPFDGSNFVLSFANNTTKSIYLDGVQLEAFGYQGSYSTYKDYGTTNLTYLKKPPAYLSCSGEETDSSGCDNYANYCRADEVGCEAYTPLIGGPLIPAVVALADYCPAECVGYEAYKQSKTVFEDQETLEYFIPKTAQACSASQAGCDEFTNLDEVARGGEGREYYQYLRLCKKPAEAGANCQNFYTWQGSDETGYQLRVYSLSAENGEPAEVIADSSKWPEVWCDDKTIGDNGQPECCDGPEDITANPFCQEFYAATGNIYYRIYANTISCSDNCHPFRKTRLGEADDVAKNNCGSSHGNWDNTNKVCIYQAIPGQGISCPAAAAGCREYRGNAGGNVFTALFDNFEDGEISGWHYGQISSEALSVAGHSLKSVDVTTPSTPPPSPDRRIVTQWAILRNSDNDVTPCSDSSFAPCGLDSDYNCYNQTLAKCVAADIVTREHCLVDVGEKSCSIINNLLTEGKTYLLSFWAKSASANVITDVNIRFAKGDIVLGDVVKLIDVGTTNLGPEWSYYTFGPFVYQYSDATNLGSSRLQFINFSNNVDFYLDNIRLQEVQNYVYVIKNSWKTPQSCDTNPWLNPPVFAPQFMLGCKQYRDSVGRVHNLKSFSHLCREQAVGCEALVDTFNSTSPFEQKFNTGDAVAEVTVPADKLVYLVNRPAYQCAAAAKGCQKLGLPQISLNKINEKEVAGHQTVYKINNPDQYQLILCGSGEVGCDEFQTGDGVAYFKDPAGLTCQRRLIPGKTNEYGWFKSGSTATTPDCPLVQPPLGAVHPGKGFAGLCPAEFSSCSLFIDPTNQITKNLIFNADFKQDIDDNKIPDGWTQAGNTLTQKLTNLTDNTLYTLSFIVKPQTPDLSFEIVNCPGIASFDYSMTKIDDNTLRFPQEVYAKDNRSAENIPNLPSDQREYSGRFLVGRNPTNCELKVTFPVSANFVSYIASNPLKVIVGKSSLAYALGNTVDKTSCNGLVNFQLGCVLFNDRSGVNYKIGEDDVSYLNFDADVSGANVNNGLAVLSCAGNCDSNVILKVRPDRTCDTWLYGNSLVSFVDDKGKETNYSLNLSSCNDLNDNGECRRPVVLSQAPTDYYSFPEEIKNLSGFSQAGLNFYDRIPADAPAAAEPQVRGYYPYAEMTQEGGSAIVANGNFEAVFVNKLEPLGWHLYGGSDEHYQDFKFRVVAGPDSSMEGNNALLLNTFYQVESEDIDIESGQEYILSAWVNTLNLRHSSLTAGTKAQLEINPSPLPLDSPDSYCDGIELLAGLPWQHLTCRFKASANKLNIILKNYSSDISSCGTTSGCGLDGFSLFDDINLKPVLKVNNEEAESNFVSRSCRLYPQADALSCSYYKDTNLYHGQYGYCLTPDPQNASQCVQWWPVDQLQGDVLPEFAGYAGRRPLYYCIEKDFEDLGDNILTSVVNVSDQLSDTDYADILKGFDDGHDVLVKPLSVQAGYRSLFRWPYVQQFWFGGIFGGVGTNKNFFPWPLWAFMYKDKVCILPTNNPDPGQCSFPCYCPNTATSLEIINCSGFGPILGNLCDLVNNAIQTVIGTFSFMPEKDSWGGWGVVGAVLGGEFPLAVPLPWHTVLTAKESTGLFQGAAQLLAELAGFSSFGLKVITDEDLTYKNALKDPVPELAGDILGYAIYLNTSDTYAGGVVGNLHVDFKPEYCKKIAQVVTSVGNNKAWASRTGIGSGYISQDKDCVFSSITGLPYNPFGWTDADSYCAASRDEKYTHINYDYQTDYPPFGSIVPPATGQYPPDWDSKEALGVQQLFYEPPLPLTNQPRLGQLHSTALSDGATTQNLERLFLKSYNIWEWQGSGDEGSYVKTDKNWDLVESVYCPGNTRPAYDPENQSDICRVRPKVENIKVNDLSNENLSLSKAGKVKLSFTVFIDPDQLPLRAYTVDWGDGEETVVSGVTLRSRANVDNPFILYHFYDYWQMQQAYKAGETDALECSSGQCITKIRIKVRDNWNADSGFIESGPITVME